MDLPNHKKWELHFSSNWNGIKKCNLINHTRNIQCTEFIFSKKVKSVRTSQRQIDWWFSTKTPTHPALLGSITICWRKTQSSWYLSMIWAMKNVKIFAKNEEKPSPQIVYDWNRFGFGFRPNFGQFGRNSVWPKLRNPFRFRFRYRPKQKSCFGS